MAVVQTAKMAGLPYTLPRKAIVTHLTKAEDLNMLFSSLRGRGNG